MTRSIFLSRTPARTIWLRDSPVCQRYHFGLPVSTTHALTGGLVGALVGLGIPEYEAKLYDGKVRGGNVLVSVHAEDGAQQKRAKEILEKAGAEDISSSTEAPAKA